MVISVSSNEEVVASVAGIVVIIVVGIVVGIVVWVKIHSFFVSS